MSKYLEAAKVVSVLLNTIAEQFSVNRSEINFDTDETVGLVCTLTMLPSTLGKKKLCDTDFHLFCKENDLTGIIFFNENGTVTFNMTPMETGPQMKICSQGATVIVPRLTEEMFNIMHCGRKINAIKLYREKFGSSLAEAKNACEQGYLLECQERKISTYSYDPAYMPAWAASATN